MQPIANLVLGDAIGVEGRETGRMGRKEAKIVKNCRQQPHAILNISSPFHYTFL
jgi:hypothetical protein